MVYILCTTEYIHTSSSRARPQTDHHHHHQQNNKEGHTPIRKVGARTGGVVCGFVLPSILTIITIHPRDHGLASENFSSQRRVDEPSCSMVGWNHRSNNNSIMIQHTYIYIHIQDLSIKTTQHTIKTTHTPKHLYIMYVMYELNALLPTLVHDQVYTRIYIYI